MVARNSRSETHLLFQFNSIWKELDPYSATTPSGLQLRKLLGKRHLNSRRIWPSCLSAFEGTCWFHRRLWRLFRPIAR